MKIIVFIKDEELLSQINQEIINQGDILYPDDLTELVIETTEHPTSVVIADFECDCHNGYDLVNQILASSTEEYPFVLMLTNPENRSAAVDCIGPIPGDFILKPVDGPEFTARLALASKTLELQRRMSENRKLEMPVSIYDPVTGLLNKEAIYERSLEEVNRVIRERTTAAIVVVSIENGAELKEKFGKEVHHQAVRLVARSLKSNVRLYDLVGRWIGSKFLLMLLGASLDNGINALERVYQSVSTVVVKLPNHERADIKLRAAITKAVHDSEKPLYMLIEDLNEVINDEENPNWMSVI